jgi:hypothetical protein
VFPNPCTGETIAFSGTAHTVSSESRNGEHIRFHLNQRFTGVGLAFKGTYLRHSTAWVLPLAVWLKPTMVPYWLMP